ncbi:MAG: cysteine hydrolase [Betaproteobacteria bacterium]|jgi:nicotinamidase-related amidase|nr:MAG: cysteine hydrolase [Betaproteobacteria bacterium]
MANIEILDRRTLIDGLYRELVLDPKQTAVVAVDMHRGHLDMDVATMPTRPEDAQRVIANARAILDYARDRDVPVIHVVLVYRRLPGIGSEGMVSPFWKALHATMGELDRLTPGRKSTVREHNLEGYPGTEIIPELHRPTDYVINNKKRLDCFYGTDLRQLLDTLGAKNVVLMGINTNTCVLNTAFTAFNLDYRVVVLSDCVASMYGDDLHALGLQNVSRCLGWVITNEQFFDKCR